MSSTQYLPTWKAFRASPAYAFLKRNGGRTLAAVFLVNMGIGCERVAQRKASKPVTSTELPEPSIHWLPKLNPIGEFRHDLHAWRRQSEEEAGAIPPGTNYAHKPFPSPPLVFRGGKR